MRHLIWIALLFAAGRSAAQPAVSSDDLMPGPCRVKVVRAPEDVRDEIDRWVAREPACRVALDVRAIPTEGGLYLLARDSTGRLYERLVPDAQAAGVLVASWIADDALEPTPLPQSPRLGPPPSSGASVARPKPTAAGALAEQPPRQGQQPVRGVTVRPGDVSDAQFRGALGVGGHVGPAGLPSLLKRQ